MPNITNRPLYTFLCHATEDKPSVRNLYKKLVLEGFDVWFDEEKLIPGQDWQYEIRKAIDEADVVIICLSKKSVSKTGFIQKEIKLALDISDEQPEDTIFIIPVRIEDCEVPERLSRWQWVNLFEENGYSKLKNALFASANTLGVVLYSESKEEILPHEIFIKVLGKAEVEVNGRTLTMSDWQTQSVRDLFLFLFSSKDGLSKEEIGNALWPDMNEPSRIKLRFKNDLYRVRRAIGNEIILFKDDLYFFNRELDYGYDVQIFDQKISQAKSENNLIERIKILQAAVGMVRGPYLEDVYGAWVQAERERLRLEYMLTLKSLAECFIETNQPQKALEACNRAIHFDPFFEETYRIAMRAYAVLGDRSAIARLYYHFKEIIQKEFDILPSPKTDDLFRELISKT